MNAFLSLTFIHFLVLFDAVQPSFFQLPEAKHFNQLSTIIHQVQQELTSLHKIFFYNNSSMDFPIDDILKHIEIPYQTMNKQPENKKSQRKMNFNDDFLYLISTENICHVPEVILKNQNAYHLVNRSKILIILKEEPVPGMIESFFKEMWKSYILNIVISNLKGDGSVSLYTYNPYRNDFVLKLSGPPANTQYFPDKTKNLYGHSVSITYLQVFPDAIRVLSKGKYIWVGLSIYLSQTLVEYCNATGLIDINENLTFGVEKFVNETYSYVSSGLESVIAQGKRDLTVQKAFVKSSILFDYINPFALGGKILLVPKATRIRFYLSFFSASKKVIGYGIVVSICVFVLAFKSILIVSGYRMSTSDLFFNALRLLTSQGMQRIKLSNPNRIMIATWSFFSVALMACTSSELLKSFVIIEYNKDIDDPYEALKVSEWKFYTFEGYINVLLLKDLSDAELIKDRVQGLPKALLYEKAFNATGYDAFLVTKAVADYIINRVGEHVYHKTNYIAEDNYSLYVRRGSPFFTTLQSYIFAIIDTGLHNYWLKRVFWYDRHHKDEPMRQIAMTYNDFEKIMRIWLSGLALSMIVFILEIFTPYIDKICARKHRNFIALKLSQKKANFSK